MPAKQVTRLKTAEHGREGHKTRTGETLRLAWVFGFPALGPPNKRGSALQSAYSTPKALYLAAL